MVKNHKRIVKLAKTVLSVIVGNLLFAFSVAAFVIPHGIIMGGTTGIGIILASTFNIDTAVLIFCINQALLIIGAFILGAKFFVTTVASSLLYPLFLGIFQRIPGISSVTDDHLLAALFAGGMLGAAIGILMRVGSSTGGMDIVNLILSKWTHRPVSAFVLINDIVIVGGQAIFSTPEQLFLGIFLITCETFILDQVMVMGKSQVQVYVISKKYEEIRESLLNSFDVGLTMNLIETGFFEESEKAILCIVSPKKLYSVTEAIQTIDPEAFITVTKIKEVRGRGFTLDRDVKSRS